MGNTNHRIRRALTSESYTQLASELLQRTTLPPVTPPHAASGTNTGTGVEEKGPLICGWSGGADSTALILLALHAGLSPQAVHVHHGLHPLADNHSRHVQELGEILAVPVTIVEVVVKPGSNLEARARDARWAALPATAVTGHTLDDRVENLLWRLMRGTGPTGAQAHTPHRHPLSGLRRSETHALCAAANIVVTHDPLNDDPRFTRTRVRNELLPLMDDIAQRDVAPLLARFADHNADLVAFLENTATATGNTIDPTDTGMLRSLPPLVQKSLLRTWVQNETGGYPPDAATIERILAVVNHGHVATEVGNGWEIRRSQGRLVLQKH